MRRTKLALVALAVMVAAFTAIAGPALAQDLDCRDARGNLIRCDGDFYAPVDDGYYWYDDDNNWWDDWYDDDYWYGYYPNYWYDDYYLSDSDCIGPIVGNECIGVG